MASEDQGVRDAGRMPDEVFKLMQSASRHWRALIGSGLLSEVIQGTVLVDGIRKEAA